MFNHRNGKNVKSQNKNLYGGKNMIVKLNLDFAKRSEEFRIEFAEICEEPDLLTELSRDKSTLVLINVAKNSYTKREDLIKLAKFPDSRVQSAVAKNNMKNYEVIEALLASRYISVRIELAQSISDKEILDKLAKDPDYRVRRVVATNPYTRIQTLSILAEDKEVSVRLAMAKWDETKIQIRKKLEEDPDENVRIAIARRKDTTPETLWEMAKKEKNIIVLKAIAKSQKTKGETLDWLAKKSVDLWAILSENPNTLECTLDILATSQSIDVLIGVLKHKNTSKKALEGLKKNANRFIRNLAYYRLYRLN